MRTLELAPYSPFEDIKRTVANLKEQFPGITKEGIDQAVAMQTTGYKPRHKGRVLTLYGADIMTADIEDIPAWPLLPRQARQRVTAHPIEGGIRLPPDAPGLQRLELARTPSSERHTVNREILISPVGLSATYCWRLNSGTWHGIEGWFQEVTDEDYDTIMRWPANRRLLRDPDIHGLYVDVRSYADEGKEIYRATNLRDAEYMIRQTANLGKKTWQGTDLPES